MFGLEFGLTALLIICLLAAVIFEFVNGFHDTANAVATVIYTNTLKPWVAVIWSGFCNFSGVLLGGITVAMGIVNLLPVETLVDQDVSHSIAMVLALLLSAIFWNLYTWYYGIPCSSSHTLIGSILGVGIAYSFLPGSTGGAVNWSKAQEIGLSLLVSPLFGFSMAILLMYFFRGIVSEKMRDIIFKEPKPDSVPPFWVRAMLILTCTSVSFFHGSNDGQKGVGLVMLILIGIVPVHFALDNNASPMEMRAPIQRMELILSGVDQSPLSARDRSELALTLSQLTDLSARVASINSFTEVPEDDRFVIRKDIVMIGRNVTKMTENDLMRLSAEDISVLKAGVKTLRKGTDYAPVWVLLLIALSLGLGTMIGWERIVVTVGEKIGKQHLTYAQGASAEMVAASTIGISSAFGWPVSTTHVLSSGIAGSMVASKGVKNLNRDTLRSMLLAWFLTLPVCVAVSGGLFLLFRWIL